MMTNPCLAVLADIHGNLPALEAVIAHLAQFDHIDGMIVAGDTTMGTQQVEAFELLQSCYPNAIKWFIRGNNEDYMLRFAHKQIPPDWQTSCQWALTRWSYQQLDQKTIDFIQSMPAQVTIELEGTLPVRVVHGSPRDAAELIFPDPDIAQLDVFLAMIPESVLVCGHSHLPWSIHRNDKLALNPGAVGGSLNGDVRAQYAMLTWMAGDWQVSHFAVPYDLNRVRAAFHQSGLIEAGGGLARAFLRSVETGQNVSVSFLDYAYSLASKAGYQECKIVPDHIWNLATINFSWEEE